MKNLGGGTRARVTFMVEESYYGSGCVAAAVAVQAVFGTGRTLP
jgi:hypothetical protein